ncbi:MAG: ribbon-helix-helix domain-containing protein [Candidatus Hodarchaeales archaeon]
MTTTVEIKGVLEERLELLVKTGFYASKSEAVRDGFAMESVIY